MIEETLELVPADEHAITNLEEATVLLRKLRFVRAKEREYKDVAENELKRIQTWLAKETEQLTSIAEYYESQLAQYYRIEKEKSPKFKLTTPYGKVSSKKDKKFNWPQNDTELISYMKEIGKDELIRVKTELDKNEFKKAFPDGVNPDTGELLVRVEDVEHVNVKVE